MLTDGLSVLLGSAATIGFVHTILGPDHYLPFVSLAKAGEWSRAKVLWVTVLCGVGHVTGSVVLGLLGAWIGWTVGGMEAVESLRGEWAAWGLVTVGVVYMSWGIRRGVRNRPHTHRHVHIDGPAHAHEHTHAKGHVHVHSSGKALRMSPWVLFIVFVLGPCEALIPLLMVPAAEHSWWGLGLVVAVFGAVTVMTMTAVTVLLLSGLRLVPLGRLERWSHALAGATILLCGTSIQWFGL